MTKAPLRSARPQSGDIIVARRTARADVYAVSVLSGELQLRASRFTDAIKVGCSLAERAGVDAWFTCNHTNYVQVAAFREASNAATR